MSAFATLSAKAPTAAPATMSRSTPTTRPTAHISAVAPRPAAAASAMGFRPGGPFTSPSPATFSSTASSPCAMGGRHAPLSRGAQLVMRAQRQNSGEDRQLRRSSSKLDEDAPFMEPLLRNLVLGLGAGALAELAHVLITAFTTAQAAGGWSALPAALTAMLASKGDSPLQPLWYLDHSVAIATWALLYIFEARTVSSILDQHPGNPGKAAHAIRSTPTLPKRLMPLSLSGVKLALYRLVTGVTPAIAASSAAAAGSAAGERTPLMGRRPSTERAASGALLTASSSSVLDRAPSTTEATTSTFPNSRSGSTTELPKVVTPLKPRGKLGGSGLRPMQKPEAPAVPGTPPKRESKREKELRERKAYLKNFWYAAAIASDVKEGQTKEVKMLGRTLVLFRDEDGKVRALDNLCPHRGAPLSKGWLKDDKATGHKCVVCPYHGWAFDGTGVLKDVPSALDQGHLPKRPLVDAYPVEEKGGFVWLFFGSKSMPADERPPIPWVPELNSPDWQPVYAEMEFDAPHWSVFDNALDMAHIHYVHKDSFGNADKPEINDMTMSQDTFGVSGSFKIHNKPANPLMAWSKVPQVPVEVQAFLPMTSAVRITLAFGVQMITFVSTVPIDEHRSITRVALIRNFATTPLLDGFVKQNIFKIMKEDQEIVEGLNPEGVKHEVSLAPDLPQIAFRRLRQEWVDMGYAVDPSTTTRHDGSLNC